MEQVAETLGVAPGTVGSRLHRALRALRAALEDEERTRHQTRTAAGGGQMNDERLLGKVGSWLKDTDTAHPDAERITARAMARCRRSASGAAGGRCRRSTAGVSRGPRRAPPLFSALKFVAAGLIIGLFGGFLLAGSLTTQPADERPSGSD